MKPDDLDRLYDSATEQRGWRRLCPPDELIGYTIPCWSCGEYDLAVDARAREDGTRMGGWARCMCGLRASISFPSGTVPLPTADGLTVPVRVMSVYIGYQPPEPVLRLRAS